MKLGDTPTEQHGIAAPHGVFRRGLRQKIWAFLAVFMLAVAATFTLIDFSDHGLAKDSTVQINTAQILVDDAAEIPPHNARWQTQSLPDNWDQTRPSVGGFAWYRLSFALTPAQLVMHAIYIPRLSMSGMVYINGQHIGGNGDFTEPLSRQWYRPQLFSVPTNLLKVGHNTVHVRLKAYIKNKGGLSEVYIGGNEAIAAQWKAREFWQIGTVKITTTITLGLSLMALLAWALQGWPSAYGYFGAAGIFWTVNNTNYLVTEVPMPTVYWELLTSTALIWTLVLILLFVIRFAGQKLLVVERVIWLFALAAPLSLWAADSSQYSIVTIIVYGALLLMGGYILKVLYSVSQRERSFSTRLLFYASLSVYLLGALDWITLRDALSYSWPNNLHFGGPILFLAVALNLFTRFGEAQTQAYDLAQSLDARVREKTLALELSHSMLRAIEASQAQTAERACIMQDMHDGLGSQLVSSLALAQGGELSPAQTYELLRGCIDDLRLAIDTSTDSRDSLPLALGNLRFRMEPRLKSAGITLRWDTAQLQDNLQLAIEQQLPVLRIIQETITNTLKHAQAQTLSVSVMNTPTQMVVNITDDGCGFEVEAARHSSRGKGLNSLGKRARVIGAELDINSTAQGTHTRLVLPLLVAAI